MRLSIIIVHYNVSQLLKNCLHSLYTHLKDFQFEIIVIDNKSPNPEWKNLILEFPQVQFYEEIQNLGFAVANNKAVQKAKGEYILLLNPDTEINCNLKELLDFADMQNNFGALGVRMHNAKGEFLPESKRAVPSIINSFEKLFLSFRKNNSKTYYRKDISENQIAKVEVITGAFFLCKKNVYKSIDGLDERYFMYGEDIDICYTLLNNGYQNWYYGKISILHHKGESTVKNLQYLINFYGAMKIFLDKYYKKNRWLYFLLLLGLKVKFYLEKWKMYIIQY